MHGVELVQYNFVVIDVTSSGDVGDTWYRYVRFYIDFVFDGDAA